MTDDPLAHLYAEGLETEKEEILASTLTHLEDLLEEGPEDEELSDHDLDELVLLVKTRLEGEGLDDEEAAELGLGTILEHAPAYYEGPGRSKLRVPIPERELVLNDVGRAVIARLAPILNHQEGNPT